MPASRHSDAPGIEKSAVPVAGTPLFPEQGLLPVVVQDAATGEILMQAWADAAALDRTVQQGLACFYSRSRQCYWVKGESSGNFLQVRKIVVDCDSDTLLYLVDPKGPTCHRDTRTCFVVDGDERRPYDLGFLRDLEETIQYRLQKDQEDSYVASLKRKGTAKMLGKVGEEAMELAEAVVHGGTDKIVAEAADLLFHMLVLLQYNGVDLSTVARELRRRDGIGGLQEKRSRTRANP